MRQLFAKKETAGERNAPRQVSTIDEAKRLNDEGYGIFWAINRFKGPRRIVNLLEITSWFIELDEKDIPKTEQWKLLKKSPLVPSLVVESKNGYHVYFDARGPRGLEAHRLIGKGLARVFKGDPRATLITQLARVPGFLHLKDEAEPFMVKERLRSDATYTEKVMLHHFAEKPPEVMAKAINLEAKPIPAGQTLSEKLSRLDHEVALSILSGKACVNFETYEFQDTTAGKKNIIINGKGTSCFISSDKRIGAKPGGPTIWQWLRYYGHDDKEIAIILKEELGL